QHLAAVFLRKAHNAPRRIRDPVEATDQQAFHAFRVTDDLGIGGLESRPAGGFQKERLVGHKAREFGRIELQDEAVALPGDRDVDHPRGYLGLRTRIATRSTASASPTDATIRSRKRTWGQSATATLGSRSMGPAPSGTIWTS